MGAHQALLAAERNQCLECDQVEFYHVIAEEIKDSDTELGQLAPYCGDFGEAAAAVWEDDDEGSVALTLEDASWWADEEWRPDDMQANSPCSEQKRSEAAAQECERLRHFKLQDPGRIATLLATGESRRRRGDFDGALQSIDMALVTHKSISAGGLRLRLSLLNSKGAVLHSKGDGALALETFKKAHSLCRTTGLIGKLQEAVLLLNIGMAHMLLGDTDAASACYSRALVVRERHKAMSTWSGIKLLERIGDTKMEVGDLNGAFETYAAALGHCQALDTLECLEGARLLSKMGTIDRMQRHFKAALQKYTHSASILLREKATSTLAFARVQGDIGIVRRELGELSASRHAFEKAVAIRIETDSLENIEGVLLLMNMGTTLRLVEDFQGAFANYSQAREIRQRLGSEAPTASDVHLLLQISSVASKLDEQQWATDCFVEAQRIRKELNMPQTPEGQQVLKSISAGLVAAVFEDSEVETGDGLSWPGGHFRDYGELSPVSAATGTTVSC